MTAEEHIIAWIESSRPHYDRLLKPHARAVRSSFGGGWIIPLTEDGRHTLSEFFDEPPAYIAPLDAEGWIVEPQDAAGVADALRAANLAWEV